MQRMLSGLSDDSSVSIRRKDVTAESAAIPLMAIVLFLVLLFSANASAYTILWSDPSTIDHSWDQIEEASGSHDGVCTPHDHSAPAFASGLKLQARTTVCVSGGDDPEITELHEHLGMDMVTRNFSIIADPGDEDPSIEVSLTSVLQGMLSAFPSATDPFPEERYWGTTYIMNDAHVYWGASVPGTDLDVSSWISATTGEQDTLVDNMKEATDLLVVDTEYTLVLWLYTYALAYWDESTLRSASSDFLSGGLTAELSMRVLADADSDGIPDSLDNCVDVANGPDAGVCYITLPSGEGVQIDGNQDGYGNPCDMDFNNDLLHSGADVAPFITAIGASDPRADINCDGVNTGADVGPGIGVLGASPGSGPSGLSCAGTIPCP